MKIYCIYLISDIVSYIFSHNITREAAISKTSLLHAKACCHYLREFSPCGLTCIRSCAITQGFYSNEKQHSLYCVDYWPDTYAYGKVWLNLDQGTDGWLTVGGYFWNVFHLISMLEVAVASIGISIGFFGSSFNYQYANDAVVGLAGSSQTNFMALSIWLVIIFLLFLACKFTHTWYVKTFR